MRKFPAERRRTDDTCRRRFKEPALETDICRCIQLCLSLRLTVPGEGSGFGAAIVAGVGCGLFGSVAEISERLNIKSVTEPIGENVSVYDDVYEKYCGLYARLKGI